MLLNVNRRDFSFSDLLRVTGATRSELQAFLRAGIVTGGVKASAGRGDHRVFSADDVFSVRLALQLKRRLWLGSRSQQRVVHEAILNLVKVSRFRDRRGTLPPDERPDVLLVTDITPKSAHVWAGSRAQWEQNPGRIGYGPDVALLIHVDRLIADTEAAVNHMG